MVVVSCVLFQFEKTRFQFDLKNVKRVGNLQRVY